VETLFYTNGSNYCGLIFSDNIALNYNLIFRRGVTFYECSKVSEELALSLSLTFFFFVEVHGVHFCKIMTDMRLY